MRDHGQAEKIVSFDACRGTGAHSDPPVAITLVLDTLKVSQDEAQSEIDQVVQFLRQNGGHLGQPVSILTLTSTGLWQVGVSSTDGNALAAAIRHHHLTSWQNNATNLSARIDQTWQASQAPYGAASIGAPAGMDPAAESALKAIAAIAMAERRMPGRKILFWVGPRWSVGSGHKPTEKEQTPEAKQVLFDKIVWFSTLLRLARVRLYSISVEETVFEGTNPPIPSLPVSSPAEVTLSDLNRNLLAIESGGQARKATNNLVRQLDDCLREESVSYTLSFNPAPAEHVDAYHDLRVEVRPSGLTARTNAGYYDQPYYLDAPNSAVRKVTVAQLDQLLREARGTSDGDLERQLSGLELTERASGAAVAGWIADVRGKKAREALVALADEAAFLDPPAADILTDAPPEVPAQRQMITRTAEYLNQTIPHLPNFFARRTMVRYEEIPSFYKGDARFTAAEPLHVVDSSRTTVLYRNGAEVESRAPPRGKVDPQLTTYGTFGPVLGAVRSALALGVMWSHWEKGSDGGRRAVFRYAVPATASQFMVGGCCRPGGDGTVGFSRMAGYHGEMAIDPASGALLRVTVQADLNGFVPMGRAEIMVVYGPVDIGGKTYICPVRSVGLWRARSLNTMTEWNTDAFLAWGPYATKLNDFRFDDYHTFRAKVRILPGFTQVPNSPRKAVLWSASSHGRFARYFSSRTQIFRKLMGWLASPCACSLIGALS